VIWHTKDVTEAKSWVLRTGVIATAISIDIRFCRCTLSPDLMEALIMLGWLHVVSIPWAQAVRLESLQEEPKDVSLRQVSGKDILISAEPVPSLKSVNTETHRIQHSPHTLINHIL
jgi:hypothetical protein